MLINLIFVNPGSADFVADMETAAQMLDEAIYNPITVNIVVGYGGAFGDLPNQDTSVGGIGLPIPVPYPLLYATLGLNDTNSISALPLGTTLDGREFFTVSTAQAKAFGWMAADLPIPDGFVDIGKNFTGDQLIAAGLHEITHAMGRIDSEGSLVTALDLFRFNEDGSGDRVYDTDIPATPAYFSMNGGTTDLADFGKASDPGDFLNGGVQGTDPFDETVGGNALTHVDLQVMDAIGFQDALSNPLEPQSVLPVAVGGTATISHGFLWSVDPAATADQLTYTIISGPEHGVLLDNGVIASSFTQADIDSGGVQYVENGDAISGDSFTFQVFGPAGNHTPTEPFEIKILDEIGPVVATDNAVSAPAGGGATVSHFSLDTVALGNKPDQVIYQLTSAPQHGALLIGGAAFPLFTQSQIDSGLVGYVNNGDGAPGDSFSFVAWDSNAQWADGNLNIAIQPSAATGGAAGRQQAGGSGGGSWQGAVPEGYQMVGVGDFHGNGASDILVRNPTSGDVGELRSDQAMTFSDIGWAAGWQVAGTTDLNGDGTSDIVFAFPGSGAIGAWIMNDGHSTWTLLGWATPDEAKQA